MGWAGESFSGSGAISDATTGIAVCALAYIAAHEKAAPKLGAAWTLRLMR